MPGYNQYASFVQETAWGTEVTPRTEFARLYGDSNLTPVKPREAATFLGNADPDEFHDGLESATGNLSIPLTYNNGIELLLYYLLGQYSVSGVGPYTHVLTLDDGNPYSRSATPLVSLSVEMNHELQETGFEAMLMLGARMRGGSGSIVSGEEAQIAFDMIGKTAFLEPKTGSPSFPDYSGADWLKWHQVTMKIDTVATTIYNMDWNIGRPHREDKGVLGSAFIGDPRMLGKREVTGTINKEWVDKDIFNDWIAGTAAIIEATAAGPGNFSMVFLWNNVRYTGAPPTLAEAEEQEQSCPWKAYRDATNTAMKITLINDTAVPFTP